MSIFDSQQDAFERSISSYTNNANSVAQGALSQMGSLATSSRGLTQSGDTAQGQIDSSQIQSTLQAGASHFAKTLGMDISLPGSISGLSTGSKFIGSGLKNIVNDSRKIAGVTRKGVKQFRSATNEDEFDTKGPSQRAEYDPTDPEDTPYSGDVGGNVKTFEPTGADKKVDYNPRAEGDNAAQDAGATAEEGGEAGGQAAVEGAEAGAGAAGEAGAQAATPVVQTTLDTGGGAAANDVTQVTDAATEATNAAATEASQAASAAATSAADSAASGLETATEEATASIGEKVASMAGGFLGSLGGALGDILPVVGIGLAGYTAYESIENMKNAYGSEGDDPYAKVRGDLAAGQAKISSMTSQISADQFSSKVGGAAPAFGSLAAPTFSTAQQMGGATGHF